MIRSKTFTITAANSTEELQDFLTSQDGKQNHLVSMTFEATDGVLFRLYLDQDRVVEVGGGCDSLLREPVMIDTPLAVGTVVKAGFFNGSGTSVTAQVTVFYKEN